MIAEGIESQRVKLPDALGVAFGRPELLRRGIDDLHIIHERAKQPDGNSLHLAACRRQEDTLAVGVRIVELQKNVERFPVVESTGEDMLWWKQIEAIDFRNGGCSPLVLLAGWNSVNARQARRCELTAQSRQLVGAEG